MICTDIYFHYNAFGLKIQSDIKLPELIEINDQPYFMPDIEIEIKDLTEEWEKIEIESRKRFVVKNNRIMFEVPDTAIFSIQDGDKIYVSPRVGVEEGKLRLYILGTCIGAVLLQKKTIPLHGSAIAINGKAYVFVGHSGAGKSTVATALINKGYQFLSDDLIPVFLSNENMPYVCPSYPHQKLWKESLNLFGMEENLYNPLFERETKYAVPVGANFSLKPIQLGGVFEIVKSEHKDVKIEKIEGLERFRTLFNHTYRNFLISRLNLMDWHFSESVHILKHICFHQIHRPVHKSTVNNLVELIFDILQEEK